LPNGAATVNSNALDLGQTSRADFVVPHDGIIEAPAMTTGILADAATVIYTIQTDTDPAFGSPIDLYPNFLTQTGAGGAGAAAVSKRFALPSDVKNYVRVKIVKSGAGDASGLTATLALLF
jgi:hypothetical protein